jgi:hypothetical protein
MRHNLYPEAPAAFAGLPGVQAIPPYPAPDEADASIGLAVVAAGLPNPVAVGYHEPTDSMIVSLNFPHGQPCNLVRILRDGARLPFSHLAGLSDAVEIATVRSAVAGGLGGVGPNPFLPGDLFAVAGSGGRIIRITDNGNTVVDPWVVLPDAGGPQAYVSLYLDRTGLWGGDLIAVTGDGHIWRINGAGAATLVADVKTRLDGVLTLPNDPMRYGGLAGRILAGNGAEGRICAVDRTGAFRLWTVSDETAAPVDIEDMALVAPGENFFGVDFVAGTLTGSPAGDFAGLAGEILLSDHVTQGGTSGLFRLVWDFATLRPIAERVRAAGVIPSAWENIAFAPAGMGDLPPPAPAVQ